MTSTDPRTASEPPAPGRYQLAVHGRTIVLGGEIDLACGAELSALLQPLLQHPEQRIIVDAAAVTFIDVAGLEPLLTAATRLTDAGAQLELSPTSQALFPVLTALRDHLPDALQPRDAPTAQLAVAGPPADAATFDPTWRGYLADHGDQVELLAASLAEAAAKVLGADGAGLALFGEALRVPLGASHPAVAQAEQAQTTQGAGPCLLAVQSNTLIVATENRLAQQWPALADAFANTPYRSTLSLPVRLGADHGLHAALDLYYTSPLPAAGIDFTLAKQVSQHIETALLGHLTGPDAATALLDSPPARERTRVWTAIGMISADLGSPAPDSLALLRARAYATGSTLDTIVEELLDQRLTTTELMSDNHADPPP